MVEPGGSSTGAARIALDGVREVYAGRSAAFAAKRERAAAASSRFAHARLVCFVLLLGAVVWAEARPALLPVLASAVLLVGFVGLVVVHGRCRREERWWRAMVEVNDEGPHRLDRDWTALPETRLPAGLATRAFADDLDLFGARALRQLLGSAVTAHGERVLAGWLLGSATEPPVPERQAAARALAPERELRDTLAAHARLSPPGDPAGITRFLAWAEATTPAPGYGWIALRWAVPVTLLIALVLWSAGIVPGSLVLVPIAVSAALTFGSAGRKTRAEMRAAFGREEIFRLFPALIVLVENNRAEAPLLERLRAGLSAGGLPATLWMGRLARIAHLAELRSAGQLWLPVQLLTMWDFHVVARMHAWRAVAGAQVRAWLDHLATIEALAALATLAHDHPDWAWPHVSAGEPAVSAEALGHPMLPPARRVDNDVAVGPPSTFLLVTGSNMSGKSTLLRAIGTNVVLAQAGAPVCARSLRMPPVELWTAIHVQDSLADGVSYFMAQLRRVKEMVTAADRARESGAIVLYLFDEMLQGTNTAERRIAATRVIRHLVDAGAIGAVTTHDLELADTPAIRSAAVPVHFRETVHPETHPPGLTFDYRLRPGVATSTNALRLMAIVGLEA
ncbi:MAG: MutS family DNA mismatch repair protein [Gemmatimonadetes bacterium]|nr:MutS family DNA mismatch repair protein [Gemmatimonadota bacterium]